MSVADYSLIPGNNTSISGISIAEGWRPRDVNDAFRQMMADIKAFSIAPSTGGAIDVTGYGAVADYSSLTPTDNTAAFEAAIAAAVAMNRPIYIPGAPDKYGITKPLNPETGAIGDGPFFSIVKPLNATKFTGAPGTAIMNCSSYGAIFANIGLEGLGTRPTAPTGNIFLDIGYNADGLELRPSSNNIILHDISTQYNRYGVRCNNDNGHIFFYNLFSSNNYAGVAITLNSGDFRFYNPGLAGNVYASIELSSTFTRSTAPGGVGAVSIFGGHGGFSPYGIKQVNGTATVGLVIVTIIDFRFEEIGNRCISLGATTNTNGLVLSNVGHSWTSNAAWKISSDVANHPIQDYAAVYGNIAGGGLGSNVEVIGYAWVNGTTGKHTLIQGNVQQFIKDDNGTAGYQVNGTGAERVMCRSQPQGFTSRVSIGNLAIPVAGATLASVTRPARHTTANMIRGSLTFQYNNTSGAAQQGQLLIDGVAVANLYFDIGQKGPVTVPFNVTATSLTTLFRMTSTAATGLSINTAGLNGYMDLAATYGNGNV